MGAESVSKVVHSGKSWMRTRADNELSQSRSAGGVILRCAQDLSRVPELPSGLDREHGVILRCAQDDMAGFYRETS